MDRRQPPDVYVHTEGRAELDYHETSDVLTGMSELKGELRRETERMNAKMGIVEAQMRLVLKLLRSQHKINDVDPEIGLQLNELMTNEQTIDDCNVEWSVADATGWKVDHYKNCYSESNDGFEDSEIEINDSLQSGSEVEIKGNCQHKSKTNKHSKSGTPSMEIDNDLEESFKSTMNL